VLGKTPRKAEIIPLNVEGIEGGYDDSLSLQIIPSAPLAFASDMTSDEAKAMRKHGAYWQ
jgi:hypothetical protein